MVQDNPDQVRRIEQELEREGLRIDSRRAQSRAGLESALDEGGWDLCILDYNGSGVAAAEAMRLLTQRGLEIPCIVVSATRGEEAAVEAMRAGAHDYLVKDRLEHLGPAVTRVLQQAEHCRRRRRADNAACREWRRFFSVLNLLPGYVVLVRSDYKARFANERFRELFGEPEGRTCYEVRYGRANPCKPCPMQRVFQSRKANEWEWIARDGRTFHSWAYPFRDTDGTWLALEVGIDITDRRELERQVRRISERERRTIGRELHDTLGQDLAALAILAKGLAKRVADRLPEEAKNAQQMVALVADAVTRVRRMAHGLDPVGLHEDGLAAALEELAREMQDYHQVNCRFRGSPVASLTEAVGTQLYYIGREATTNAARHARASRIDIRLSSEGENVTLRIADDGQGLPTSDGDSGTGMQIMRHRAAGVGGALDVKSGPEGTIVTCTVPLRRACRQD